MAIIKLLGQSLGDLLSIIYPDICVACLDEEVIRGDVLCLNCSFDIFLTNHHLLKENEFTDKFWGRFELEYGMAAYPFTKKGKMQRLLHHLKYKGRNDIGWTLGYNYGKILNDANQPYDFDVIIPVPIHKHKLKKRGYNQAKCIADGVGEAIGVPISCRYLHKKKPSLSQTAKSRQERFESVFQSFELLDGELLSEKHLLIVDDVITTGATLEACAFRIREKVPECKISMMTLAIARH